ncbi:hypothetical protein TNCV_4474201 [Trichonephila clavipes]|nr:hypothetical protein TNCV_4474201 [Trichonephila clavipes]
MSTIQVAVRFVWFHSNFEGEHPGEGVSPTFHFLRPTSREDLQLDGCLENPIQRRHYTLTNIHVFTRIRTEALRRSSQRR